MPDKPNTERHQRIEDHAKHLAAMVTPKDISSYRKILTDNEQYLAIELARFAAATAPQDGLREADPDVWFIHQYGMIFLDDTSCEDWIKENPDGGTEHVAFRMKLSKALELLKQKQGE